jgi:Tol biopolymer transport system component
MGRLVLLLTLLLPIGVASAEPSQPLLLFTTTAAAHGSDVIVAHLDGTGRTSLTGGVGFATNPAWSPDGNEVAFSTNRETNGTGPGEIYVVNADGSGLRAVTHGAPPNHFRFGPTWSQDGSRIAYLESNGTTSESADVWVVPVAGGEPRRLTMDGGPKRGVAWQPGGSLVLYDHADASPAWGLWTVDTQSGMTRRLADTRPFGSGEAGYWSPDGTRIAFPDGVGRLEVAAPDGSQAQVLATGPIVGAPSWSPDGRSVAYAATRILPFPPTRFGPPSDTDVYVTDAASGQSQRLTGWLDPNVIGPQSDTPSWWPDGKRLFFRTFRGGADRVLWQMNADGTCQQPVPALTGLAAGPWWQPHAVPAGANDCVDLRLRASVDRSPIALGAPTQFTVTVENRGNRPATHVAIEATAAGGDLTLGANTVFDVVLPGQAVAVSGSWSSRSAGLLTATVTARAAETDVTPADATATLATTVLPCTVVGTFGPDVLTGTPGNDRICALPGPDRIDGGKGNDYLDAGNGADTIIGGPGNDTIIARGGSDVIYARDGQRDWIDCGTEYDIAVVDRIDHVRHCEKVARR